VEVCDEGGSQIFVMVKMVDTIDDSFDGAYKRLSFDAILDDLTLRSIFYM
jgi:hypothetical protein